MNSKKITLSIALFILISHFISAQGVGIGVSSPQSQLDVEGNAVIGATYSGTTAAPANGLLVEGNTGIGNSSPTARLDVTGANGYDQLRLRTQYTPTGTADANGSAGSIAWNSTYIYVKTSFGWKRASLSAF